MTCVLDYFLSGLHAVTHIVWYFQDSKRWNNCF